MYLGGKIDCFDNCNPDYMPIIYMKKMAKKLDYDERIIFYHNFLKVSLTDDLLYLTTNERYQMPVYLLEDRVVDVFAKCVDGIHQLEWIPSDLDEVANVDSGVDFGIMKGIR